MSLSVQFLLILGLCSQMAKSDCPRLCECKWKSGKESVICLNANLSVVPLHLDAGTQVLDLTGNNLVSIKHDEFSNAGLVNLQKVYISKCRLKTLERYAFRNLINLVELDLSYNALATVPSHTFDSIPELRELKLNGNPMQKISNDAFVNLQQLIRLEITDCRIALIELRAFHGLEQSLEWLKLDRNKLTQVKSASFTILQSLHGLELAGNPWNCSCVLRPLREWMLRKNVPFGVPPVCTTPKRLNGKPWDKLDLDEFACVPEIFAYKSSTHGIEGKNVTMTCRISGIPEPNVRWLMRNKVIANLTSNAFPSGKKLYVVHLQNQSSDLTIFSADLQDAGTYVCSAENKAGKAEASVTLAVSKKPPEAGFNSKVLVVSILTGIAFALLSCFLAVCACSVRKRQVLKWRNRECLREDNYEKIEMNHHKVSSGNVGNGGAMSNEISIVSGRRNGEYRVVPGADTDQEPEDEDDNGHDLAASKKISSYGNDNVLEKRWNSPEHLLDPEDLHIPRRTLKEARDNIKKTCTSTCGIYKQYTTTAASLANSRPIASSSLSKNPCISSTNAYVTTCNRDLSSSNDKKIPDLIENSSSRFNSSLASITRPHSEGGSVSDINELFCTLPRKKSLAHSSRYHSTDSQAPLLAESRYGSSGGESSNSSYSHENSFRRMSDTQKYPVVSNNLNRNRVNKMSSNRSSSYLNLTREELVSATNAPLATTELNSTPLLDVSNLESRVLFKREVTSPTTLTPNANSYDYHAAQLERFLEEYRSLQKQLTKMKETCDNLCQERTQQQYLSTVSPVTPSSSDDNNTNNSAKSSNCYNLTNPLAVSPNSNQSLEDSVDFRNFENELTKYLMSHSVSNKNLAGGGAIFSTDLDNKS